MQWAENVPKKFHQIPKNVSDDTMVHTELETSDINPLDHVVLCRLKRDKCRNVSVNHRTATTKNFLDGSIIIFTGNPI
jgi:hypothetical protein